MRWKYGKLWSPQADNVCSMTGDRRRGTWQCGRRLGGKKNDPRDCQSSSQVDWNPASSSEEGISMTDQPTDVTKGARKNTFDGLISNGGFHQFLISGMGLLSTFQVYKWQGHGAGDLRQYRGREHGGHGRTSLQSNARTSLAVQTMYEEHTVLRYLGCGHASNGKPRFLVCRQHDTPHQENLGNLLPLTPKPSAYKALYGFIIRPKSLSSGCNL